LEYLGMARPPRRPKKPHGLPAEAGVGGEPRPRGPAPAVGAPTGRKELEHPERERRGCAGRDGPSRERRPHPPIGEGHKQRRREQRRPPAGRQTGLRQGSKPNGRDAMRLGGAAARARSCAQRTGRKLVVCQLRRVLVGWPSKRFQRIGQSCTDDPTRTFHMRAPTGLGTGCPRIEIK
jgi:hypothetical protein